jgi:hypothetical protein
LSIGIALALRHQGQALLNPSQTNPHVFPDQSGLSHARFDFWQTRLSRFG